MVGLGEYQQWLGILEIMPVWPGLASTGHGWVFWTSYQCSWAWQVPAKVEFFLEIMPAWSGLASLRANKK